MFNFTYMSEVKDTQAQTNRNGCCQGVGEKEK